MKIFNFPNNIQAVCHSEKTRNGFRHLATLFVGNMERETVKISYLNRTWEAYEFQSVLERLFDKTVAIDSDERQAIKNHLSLRLNDGWNEVQKELEDGKLYNLVRNKVDDLFAYVDRAEGLAGGDLTLKQQVRYDKAIKEITEVLAEWIVANKEEKI